jgi:hypothetical protein
MTNTITDHDLTKQAPRSPRQRFAGFAIAFRAIDKCRASLAGTLGEYHYDCPLDNMLFSFKGISGEQFKTAVRESQSDEEIGAWLLAHGTAKTPAEINTWSNEMETGSPIKDPARRAHFMDNCSRLMLNPQTNTTFDLLEADDRAAFFRSPAQLLQGTMAASTEAPVFPQVLHQFRPDSTLTSRKPDPKRRGNTFSKSRDLREDRGTRQAKTAHYSQSLPHGR